VPPPLHTKLLSTFGLHFALKVTLQWRILTENAPPKGGPRPTNIGRCHKFLVRNTISLEAS
jgi:hypothetical protein